MSAAFGGPRGSGSKAPEKGVFPLDHFAECQKAARTYLACLEEHDQDASRCIDLSKAYLECRMQRDLMAQQDLKELGLTPVKPLGADKGPDSGNLR
ncbi:hypothetical protein CHLRE_10g454550v5 [Chlamydomonas reinhardtii]|uniref:Cytochrome c oxidase assembly protein COX19 n=2 Tax=Chlamydomonas reinhardtii TaxID=3055 RepID=A8I0B6_CHLRE|nr:uncharacterized protein CHLRE_10g454550v5 [Chlamydomonas reinhardtii]XP_042920428.1 uncharacterized protein CHLRE_10g454550v5 [Chlamydomonas reinhardtii]PNW77855.1 hypothetical protein CHLRE_10g454550v5 [Chlamydomonas reinhardtii]PNW77856.1 hypothetical protein CHLRE_10g454550v5 [Chlamydomonas reinhardtii]DAA79961.1 TPA_inf: mitochondrial cytochrome c oxidase assembly protein COX19 precursor [Chlamydomonas reinhardtii]|eukprot:XP_001698539.1 cytochrome c oxidase assembly protein [Chlamydomonas reinhardtii]